MSERHAVLRSEVFAVILVLIAFLAVNIATASLSPTVWMDEVMFSDPAINYRLTGNFTSTAWYAQDGQRFWSGNAPLHSMLLTQWLQFAPISPTGIRSINFVYVAGAAWAFWLALRRSSILGTPFSRVLFLLLMLTGYGISFSYRSGRYDGLGILLVAVIALIITSLPTFLKLVALAGVCALLPWAGLQLVVLACVVLVLHILAYRSARREHLAVCIGIAVGALALLAFFASKGTLGEFAQSVLPHASAADTPSADRLLLKIREIPQLLLADRSSLLLLPTLVIALLVTRSDPDRRLFLIFVTAAVLAVPASLHLAGKFPTYYSWMVFIPLCIAAALAAERLSGRRLAFYGVLCLSLFASTTGLPSRIAVALFDKDARNHDVMSAYVSNGIKAHDVVYVDFPAYYPSKLKAASVFLPPYLAVMSPNERAAITVAILQGDVPAESLMFLHKAFGGSWSQAAPTFAPSRPNILSNVPIALSYKITVYRRSALKEPSSEQPSGRRPSLSKS